MIPRKPKPRRATGTPRTHGKTYTREYQTWEAMKRRCFNPRYQHYDRYGGRGITVCDRWLNFEGFYEDMGPRPSSQHSIERINNDGNYEPSNCKWATKTEQCNNRRGNKFVVVDGCAMTVAEACRARAIDRSRVDNRLSAGWPIDKALDLPPVPNGIVTATMIAFRGETMSMREWERKLSLPVDMLSSRLGRLGWDLERAMTTPARGKLPNGKGPRARGSSGTPRL